MISQTYGICSRLAEYIESEPLRKKAQQEAQRAKLEALEKKLSMAPGAPGGSSDQAVGQKRRLEDTEYIEQSREIVDNVKNAVSVGEHMLACSSMTFAHMRCSHAEEEKEGEDE